MSTPAHIPKVGSVSARMRVGEWTVFPELRRLQCADEIVRVSPKAMAVLAHLAEKPGEVVSRETLLATVWNGTLPTDDVLTHAVAELRRVFGDERAAPRYIETIPKTGYRLIATVLDGSSPPVDSGASCGGVVRGIAIAAAVSTVLVAILAAGLIRSQGEYGPVSDQPLDLLARPITSEPGVHGQPALSPGGDRVAYIMRTSNELGYDLFVGTGAASSRIRLTETDDNDFSPAWSPDGGSLAFVRFSDQRCSVMVMPSNGGQPRRIAGCTTGGVSLLDWSPDGEWIAFSTLRSGAEVITLHEVSTRTGEIRAIEYETLPASHDVHPRYSPDGRLLAFQRRIGGYSEVFVVPREGGEVRRITHFEGSIHGSDWWIDGQSLVVASEHGGLRGLWWVGLDSGEKKFLGLVGARYPSTNSGTSAVAFERGGVSADLVELELNTNKKPESSVIYPSMRSEMHPRYSPNGRRVVFVSDRTGAQELWVAGESGLARLTHHEGGEIVSPNWHPGGSHVAYVFRNGEHGSLFVVDSEARRVRRLTGDDFDVVSAAYIPPGDTIAFSARRGNEWKVWRVRTDGAEPAPLPIRNAGTVASDRKGEFLYFSKLQGDGLWRARLDGSGTSKVTNRIKYWNLQGWDLVDSRLYYLDIDARNATPGIHELDLASGASRRILDLDFTLSVNTLAVSPDASRFSVVSGGPEESDVLIARLD